MKEKVLKQLKERRLIIAVFVLFFLLNAVILYNTFSEKTTSTVWDGTVAKKFADGDGSIRNPYIINNGSELAFLFQEINGENAVSYFNKFYEIKNNIDLNGNDFSFAKSAMTFSGHINGNGYSIFNFTISENYLSEDGKSIDYSLFDSLFNANISNINFRDITFNVGKIDKKEEKEEPTNEKTEIEENKEEPLALLLADEINLDSNEPEEPVTTEPSNPDEEGISSSDNTDLVDTPTDDETPEPIEEPVTTEPSNPDEEGISSSDNTDLVDTPTDDETPEPIEEPEKPIEEPIEEPTENSDEPTIDIEPEEKVEVEKITISLFKNVEQSTIKNITINNVKLNIGDVDLDVESSLFILNDNEGNTFENISLSNEYSRINSPMFINNYNNSTIKNIVYTSNGLPLINNYDSNSSDTIFEYYIDNDIMTFKKDYSTNSILKALNENSTLKWKLDNNIFKIVNNGKNEEKRSGAKRAMRTAPSAHDSGVSGSIIYINDYEKDANYYEGLNYTYSSDATTPTTANKNIYKDSNLVYVQVTYSGVNIEGTKTGEVSTTEHVSQYIYYKVYPVNNNGTANNDQDDYIEMELIDNPFANRPNGLVFQGWLTNYQGVEILLDTDMYIRNAKVPVSYTSGTPDNIQITYNAIWGNGAIYNYTTSWSNTFNNLAAAGFHAISSVNITYEVNGLYIYTYVSNNSNFPTGAVDVNGNSLTGRCRGTGYPSRCYYYILNTADYNSSTTYYSLVNGTMSPTTPNRVETYNTEVPVGNTIAGYYRQTTVPNGASYYGYYNSSGNMLTTGQCNTNGGCSGYYELIQYYNANNQPEVVTEGSIYYYKTTRDTNIVVLTATMGGVWASGQNKPFTFTGINNGTKYNVYWGLYYNRTSYTVTCYADTRIEHMNIYTDVSRQTGDAVPSGNRSIIASNFNVKLGRGLKSSSGSSGNTTTNYVTFRYAQGSKQGTTGSTSALERYSFIVESGIYNNIATVAVSGTNNYYIYAHGTYGNDYDRIVENNSSTTSNLDVVYDLSGSFGGNIRSTAAKNIAIYTDVKSGIYGSNKYDVYTGVYIGSQIAGAVYAARAGMIEGGYIYNLVGGPLSQSSMRGINDNIIYITGGSIDLVFGGAGVATTYGNKIVQVTGGQINYSVFAGSNGVKGTTSSKAQVDSDTYVYVGGNAVIGNPTYVSNSTRETESDVEAGSVFGIGNGRSGNNYDDIGSSNNSYVVINGDAVVNFNVYGGGNYGGACRAGSGSSYSTNVNIYGGTVKGSVYGGGNNNAGGTSSKTCNANVNMTGGRVEGSVYGGSRAKGVLYGSTTLNITGGTILTDVYGGGEGGYTSSSSTGTYVENNVSVTIGDSNSGPTINGSVYGGSAFGTVNSTSTNPSANSKTVTVTVNNGTINDSVFGGAKGSSSVTPYVPGYITVNINGGTITNVFGGFDEAGKPSHDPIVNIAGGNTTNVYGGGNKTSVDNTTINMTGGTVSTMYGGSNQSGTVQTTTISVSNGSVGTIFGGNNQGGTCSSTQVTVTGGSVTSAIYGGGNLVNTGTTKIDIYNASNTIPNVYGGGNQAGATTTEVNLHNRSGSNSINITNVYGGSNQSGAVTTSNVNVDKGTVTNIYGGGNSVGVTNTNVTLSNAGTINVTTIYGGSNQTGNVSKSDVEVNGGTVGTIYGANNAGGVTTDANVTLNAGTVGTIYGGGNVAQATDTHVEINNGSVTTIFGGGNAADVTNTTNVEVNNASGTITAIYGGGNQAGADTTNVTISPSSNSLNITSVYGGSNRLGDVDESNVTITHGTITNLYGGNNAGGETDEANIEVSNADITNLFGGGNEADTGSTNITINSGTINVVYGGGNAADVENDTTLELLGGSVTTNLFGGGNNGEVGGSTNVTIENASIGGNAYAGGNGATATVSTNTNMAITDSSVTGDIYGGGNNGTVTGNTNITVDGATIGGTAFAGGNGATATVSGNTTMSIEDSTVTHDVYGGGNNGVVTGNTNITLTEVTVGGTAFAGGNGSTASVGGSTTMTIEDSNITHDIYGGGNNGTVGGSTNITLDGVDIGGSAFAGGNGLSATVTGSTELTITDGTLAHDVYGGGNNGTVGTNTSVIINGTTTIDGSVYAAGNGTSAAVNGSTELKMDGITVGGSIYGGGNNGTVLGSTDVMINDSTLGASAYAGGNGSTATVYGNTSITVGGTTEVGTSSCAVLSTCSVFGGGNAATTGSQATDNSMAYVKIAGAIIHGNVYGGANTSKVYGATDVNIGNDVTLVTGIDAGDIVISGTVFGGGEANASGSDEYDWTFVSVTQGINVNINGANRTNFEIDGSIFGSGNASTAAGDSTVTIKNYGTFNDPKRNVSIQRTNLLVIDNSAIVLEGATDRENEYSDVLFTLSRIDELDLKNNSTLFLETGANLLKEFKSLTSNGSPAAVQIDTEHGTVTKNVDNRVYMFADKKLNIAKNQSVTDYGEVSGMSFFGMYKYNGNGTINTGIYNKYNYDDVLDWGGVFDNVSSYVLGLHKTNHDIEVDGFYTNYIDEETSKNKINYIEPIPPVGQMYMWTIGEGVIEYEVDLSASKYSTLGTTELSLRDFTEPNTSFQILGFDYSELASGIQLVEKTSINKIANTTNDADTIMGLSMETSNSGWLTNGYTSFLSRANNNIIGTREYVGGNSTSTPTVLFYLHHSKNIGTSGDMGRVRIQLMSVRQINALTKETKRLIVTVNLTRTLFDTVNYEGALTPGRKYDLFTSTTANITSSSAISTYYSLFNSGSTIYRTGYYRTLVSNYVLPLNTKITMIDLSKNTPEYYYHIITQSDVNAATTELSTYNEVTYKFSMFEVMGAINSGVYYNDASKNSEYCTTNNYCNEDFIFIIDFGDTNITSDALNNELLIEIRNTTNDTIYSVLAPQHLDLVYNIYANKDAVIDIDGELDKDKIYAGESFTADLNIEYTQSTVGSATIYDTHYFDSKLGIKISLINEDGNVVPGITLLGLYYTIGEDRYYPNIDGTTRVKIADKVDSAEKWIIVNTGTSSLASGDYKLRVETFGSPDGIYYGLNSSDYIDFDIEIVNEIYGLNIETSAEEMMIDAETGLNTNGVNTIVYNVRYNSGLTNPKINFKMYRRNYDEVYDTTYTLVDALDYFDTVLFQGYDTNEYVFLSDPTDNAQVTFTLKDNLLTGTYKIEFILYGDTSVIGTLERYIIIK